MGNDSRKEFFLGFFLRLLLFYPLNLIALFLIFVHLKTVIENFGLSFFSSTQILWIVSVIPGIFLLLFYLTKENILLDRKYILSKIGLSTYLFFHAFLFLINPKPEIHDLYQKEMGGVTEIKYQNEYKCEKSFIFEGNIICERYDRSKPVKTNKISEVYNKDGSKIISCGKNKIFALVDNSSNERQRINSNWTIIRNNVLVDCKSKYLETDKGFEYIWRINYLAKKIEEQCDSIYDKNLSSNGPASDKWIECFKENYTNQVVKETKKPMTYEEFWENYYNEKKLQ